MSFIKNFLLPGLPAASRPPPGRLPAGPSPWQPASPGQLRPSPASSGQLRPVSARSGQLRPAPASPGELRPGPDSPGELRRVRNCSWVSFQASAGVVASKRFLSHAMAVSCNRMSPRVPPYAFALSPWGGLSPAVPRAAFYNGVILPVLEWGKPFPRSVTTYFGCFGGDGVWCEGEGPASRIPGAPLCAWLLIAPFFP